MQEVEKDLNDIKKKIIQFDSCTAMLNSLSNCLREEHFKGVGVAKNVPAWVGDLLNILPSHLLERIYQWGGWFDALPEDKIKDLTTEDITRWAVSLYSERKFPGVMFGSSNGAAIHLAAALGIPWLPQTFLLAMRRDMAADELKKDVDWGREAIKPLLSNNPDLFAHQMHDPLQDRLMITKMGYFRIKLLKMENPYEQFLNRNLNERSPVISIECQFPWPSYKIQDRHFFQIGGFGGLDPYEYLEESEKVKSFLKNVKAPVDRWDYHHPVKDIPEAEWGFREETLESYKKFAESKNLPFYRLIFSSPEDLTPFIADLYQWWYEKRGVDSNQVLIENFGLLEPYWSIKSRSIPLWLAFNTTRSAKLAKNYLAKNSFDKAYLMLMSNGVKHGIGLTPIEEWKELLSLSQTSGEFLGVDEALYPLDFGTFIKYHNDLEKKLKICKEEINPLTFEEFDQYAQENSQKYGIRWEEY